MKLTTKKIVNFIESGILNFNYPTKMNYILHTNVEACKAPYKSYYEAKEKLLDKFAKKDEEGQLVVIDNHYDITDLENWNKEIQELFSTEVDVPITMLSADILDKCDQPEFHSLSIPEIMIIDFMIEN